MRLAYRVVEPGGGAAVGEFATARTLADFLGLKLVGPLLGLLFEVAMVSSRRSVISAAVWGSRRRSRFAGFGGPTRTRTWNQRIMSPLL